MTFALTGLRKNERLTYLRILVPDFNCPVKNWSVGRIDPVEEHHVRDLGVEGKDDAAEIAGETDHSLADLLRITDTCKCYIIRKKTLKCLT
jgi:hypothetical protein